LELALYGLPSRLESDPEAVGLSSLLSVFGDGIPNRK
jgi:hypothetical protein